MLGRTEGKGRRWVAKDETVRYHQQLSGDEFEQTLEIVKDRRAWYVAVPGITKSQM